MVYALHHPAGTHDPAAWNADFGCLVKSGVAPVADGERTNYEPAPTSRPAAPRSSCRPDAGLADQVLQQPAGPTTMNAATWSCQSNSERQPDQGVGSQIMAWFKQHDG